jgi:hypothetical protein
MVIDCEEFTSCALNAYRIKKGNDQAAHPKVAIELERELRLVVRHSCCITDECNHFNASFDPNGLSHTSLSSPSCPSLTFCS